MAKLLLISPWHAAENAPMCSYGMKKNRVWHWVLVLLVTDERTSLQTEDKHNRKAFKSPWTIQLAVSCTTLALES